MISLKAQAIKPSATLAITAKAKEMKEQGKEVYLFGAGEPDFPTPLNVKKIGIKAIEENYSYYTAVAGSNELKKAVQEKFRRDNNLEYNLDEITCGAGGKQILFNAFISLLNKGDEAILASPYWVSYIEQINFAEGKPVIVKTTGDFKLKASQVEKALTKKTKVLLLNSPNNPTGAIIDEKELKKISEIAVQNNLTVLSDEVYEPFVYEGKHKSIAGFGKEIKEKTLVINAVSKTYSMTGWRLGYCAGPKELINAMNKIQAHSTSNACSISQKAAAEALTGQQESVQEMKNAFQKRRDLMASMLNSMKGIKCDIPGGAFYCFPDISETGMNSTEFASKLLEETGVTVIPGIEFGNDKCVRLSYATKEETIKNGMQKMKEWVEKK
ncbi:MAG: pyridoxal phosphate-dependent aminotransferase [Candidatus Diapherotrites archaeon]|nr:pyridoxal phosphate-dependent aminotransferase [Candidatus Diapherotrites archaeon]